MAGVGSLNRVDCQHPQRGGFVPMVGVLFAKVVDVHGAIL
jgi:hypothetical protein